MATLTQLSSFLFTLTYQLFIFYPLLAPRHLPWWIASPGGALAIAEHFFLIVISPSCIVPPRIPCGVLTELLCPKTTWVYPSLPLQTLPEYTLGLPQHTLQHPLHILGWSLHVQHRLTFI